MPEICMWECLLPLFTELLRVSHVGMCHYPINDIYLDLRELFLL